MTICCKNCGKEKNRENSNSAGSWWSLSDYHGLSGTFCRECYDIVSHDSYGNPENPEGYLMVFIKLHGA